MMNDIFLIFLSLSVSGAALALLIFLLQKMLRNKFSQRWHYYIWLVVIARLLLPFSIGINLMNDAVEQVVQRAEPATVAEEAANGFVADFDVGTDAPQPQEQARTTTPSLKTIAQYLWIVWIAGGGILLVKKIAGYHAFLQYVKVGCEQVEDDHLIDTYFKVCEELSIKRAPALHKNDLMTAPMLVGVFRPFIVIPNISDEKINIKNILQHELVHYKRGDIFYKWLAQIAVCVHWFNPLIYWVNRRINLSCELSCDEALIRHMDKEQKYWYGETLLSTVRPLKGYTNKIVSVTLNEDAEHLEERLDSIMKYTAKSRITKAFTVGLTLMLIIGATTIGAYAATGRPGNTTSKPPASQTTTPPTSSESATGQQNSGNVLFSYSNPNLYANEGFSGGGGDLTITEDTIVQVRTEMSSTSGSMVFAIQQYGDDNNFSNGLLIDPQTKQPINIIYYKSGGEINDTTTVTLAPGNYLIAIAGPGPLRDVSYSFTGTIVEQETPGTYVGTITDEKAFGSYRDGLTGLIDDFEARRTIYDNDTWIANAGQNDLAVKGYLDWSTSENTGYYVSYSEAAGCLSLFEFDVQTECTLSLDYFLSAIAGRTKLVYVAPDGTVALLVEWSEGSDSLSGTKLIELPVGKSEIRLVMDNANADVGVNISGTQAVEQATIYKIAG